VVYSVKLKETFFWILLNQVQVRVYLGRQTCLIKEILKAAYSVIPISKTDNNMRTMIKKEVTKMKW